MSTVRTIELICPQCGEKIFYNYYDSVNVTIDPELKSKILSGEIFIVKCDHCGFKERFNHDLLYNDMEKNVFINLKSGYADLIYENEELIKGQIGISPFPKLHIKYIGASSYYDFITAITCIDHDLDYRIVYIIKSIFEDEVINSIKDSKNTKFIGSFLGILENSKNKKCLTFIFVISTDGEVKYKTVKFSKKYYKLKSDAYSKKLDLINPCVMNKDLVDILTSDTQSGLEVGKYYFVFDRDKNCYLCKASEIIKNDIKERDNVLFLCNDNLIFGAIKKTIEVSNAIYESCPNEKYGKIVDLKRNFSLDNTYKDKTLVNNERIMKRFKKRKGKLNAAHYYKNLRNSYFYVRKLEYGSLSESIVPIDCGQEISCIDIYSNEETKGHFPFYKYEIYSFNDIIKYVKNRCQGIIIDGEIILDSDFVCDYITYCSMLDADDMRKFLNSLSEKEKFTIDDASYEYINKVYFENKNVKQIAEEYHKDEKEIHEYLDKGYEKLMDIAFVRFK